MGLDLRPATPMTQGHTPRFRRQLEDARWLGAIGSVLLVLSALPIPILGTGFSFSGSVLVILAVAMIARRLGYPRILGNYIASVAMAFGASFFAGLFFTSALAQIPILEDVVRPLIRFPELLPSLALNVVLTLILAYLALWILYLFSAVFLRRSFEEIASRLGVEFFSLASIVYLLGAILVAVFVGFVVIAIAHALQTVAFVSLPGEATPSSPSTR